MPLLVLSVSFLPLGLPWCSRWPFCTCPLALGFFFFSVLVFFSLALCLRVPVTMSVSSDRGFHNHGQCTHASSQDICHLFLVVLTFSVLFWLVCIVSFSNYIIHLLLYIVSLSTNVLSIFITVFTKLYFCNPNILTVSAPAHDASPVSAACLAAYLAVVIFFFFLLKGGLGQRNWP